MNNGSVIRKFAQDVEQTINQMKSNIKNVKSKYSVHYDIKIKGKFLGITPKFSYLNHYSKSSFKEDLLKDLSSYVNNLATPLNVAKTLNKSIVVSMSIKLKYDTERGLKTLGTLNSTLDLDITGSTQEIKNTLTSKLKEVEGRV